MAVQKDTEVRGSGFVGNHWVLGSMAQHRKGASNDFDLSGTLLLWKDKATYDEAGKNPVRGEKVQVFAGEMSGNPSAGQMLAALDAAAVLATVPGVRAVRAVAAVEAVAAVAGTPAVEYEPEVLAVEEDLDADPPVIGVAYQPSVAPVDAIAAIAAVQAVAAVAAVVGVREVPGGPLEGGTVV